MDHCPRVATQIEMNHIRLLSGIDDERYAGVPAAPSTGMSDNAVTIRLATERMIELSDAEGLNMLSGKVDGGRPYWRVASDQSVRPIEKRNWAVRITKLVAMTWRAYNRKRYYALKFGFVVDGRGTILPTSTRKDRGDYYRDRQEICTRAPLDQIGYLTVSHRHLCQSRTIV